MQPAHKIVQPDFAGSRPSKKRPSRIGGPDLIFAEVPFPHTEINRLRGHTHPFFAFPQRLVLVYQLSNIAHEPMYPANLPCGSSRGAPWSDIQRYSPSFRRKRYCITNGCRASNAWV